MELAEVRRRRWRRVRRRAFRWKSPKLFVGGWIGPRRTRVIRCQKICCLSRECRGHGRWLPTAKGKGGSRVLKVSGCRSEVRKNYGMAEFISLPGGLAG